MSVVMICVFEEYFCGKIIIFFFLRYFGYSGSFTTPTCDEGVVWNVIADYCVVPQAFLDMLATFDSMSANGGNFRPPQPLNGREISGEIGKLVIFDHYFAI